MLLFSCCLCNRISQKEAMTILNIFLYVHQGRTISNKKWHWLLGWEQRGDQSWQAVRFMQSDLQMLPTAMLPWPCNVGELFLFILLHCSVFKKTLSDIITTPQACCCKKGTVIWRAQNWVTYDHCSPSKNIIDYSDFITLIKYF